MTTRTTKFTPREALARFALAAGVFAATLPHSQPASAAETLALPLVETELVIVDGSDFGPIFDEKVAAGMRVTDLEVDDVHGTDFVSAIFQTNVEGLDWRSSRNMTSEEFSDKWTEYENEGLRLIDQESYMRNGERQYAGVWVENVAQLRWESYRNVDHDRASALFDEKRADGLRPIDVESYRVGGERRYSMIWIENPHGRQWKEYRNVDSATYARRFEEHRTELDLIDVESYKTDNGQRYAAIWVEKEPEAKFFEQRDLRVSEFRELDEERRDDGYRLVDFEYYPVGDSRWRVAAIWEPTPDVLEQLLRSAVLDFNGPGLMVSVMHAGEVVISRAHGASNEAGDSLDGSSILRLASVSKALAGIITMQLVEDPSVDIALDHPVSKHLPDLDGASRYTVGDLLSIRSCAPHYAKAESYYESLADAVADIAAKRNEIDDAWCTPARSHNVGHARYSTHGYTILAAVLEAATGDPISEILRDRLAERFSLDTLRVEDQSQSVDARADIWDDGDWLTAETAEDSDWDLAWKALGGGLEASAHDLATLGSLLDQGKILENPADLWDPPSVLNPTDRGECEYRFTPLAGAPRRPTERNGITSAAARQVATPTSVSTLGTIW